MQRTLFSTRNAATDIAKTHLLNCRGTAARVLKERVAPINDRVTAIEHFGQRVDGLIHRRAGVHHHQHRARRLQGSGQLFKCCDAGEVAFGPMVGHEFFGALVRAVVDRDPCVVRGQVAGKIRAHRAETDDADLFFGHAHTIASPKAEKLLILSRQAGTMDARAEAKLRAAFADHRIIDFDPRTDFEKLIAPRAPVVVAGGDGTVEFVVRKLADKEHPLGIVPLGTFNNLAHALGLPDELDQAIDTARRGRPQAITLGKVNGHVFVEACAIGMFGDAIVLGDSAKDLHFGEAVEKLREVIGAEPFSYELTGDLEGQGTAMSLVLSNTSSIGAQLPVSQASPADPYLELSASAGKTRTDMVIRLVESTLLQKHVEDDTQNVFHFRKLRVKTRPRARVYADNQLVGRTPATVAAEVSALKVLLPAAGNHK